MQIDRQSDRETDGQIDMGREKLEEGGGRQRERERERDKDRETRIDKEIARAQGKVGQSRAYV